MGYVKYILILLSILSFVEVKAVNFASSVNPSGSWTTNGNWDDTGYPDDTGDKATLTKDDSISITSATALTLDIGDLVFNQNSALYVGANVTLNVASIEVNKNARLYVDGALNISGNMNMKKDSDLAVEADGDLQIDGDFSSAENVSLHVEGDMQVDGDFTLGTSGVITGTPGAISVDGAVTNNGSDEDAVIDGALPVELLYFKAVNLKEEVRLEWETAIEINNDFFTIERSYDGYEYEILATVGGNGDSDVSIKYTFYDAPKQLGNIYYRLSQTDFDGTTEILGIKAVQNLEEVSADFEIYPNPINANPLNLTAKGLESNAATIIRLSDLSGRLITIFEETTDYNGTLNIQIEETQNLATGTYLITVDQVRIHLVQRLIKH